jgi:hypothetical protein
MILGYFHAFSLEENGLHLGSRGWRSTQHQLSLKPTCQLRNWMSHTVRSGKKKSWQDNGIFGRFSTPYSFPGNHYEPTLIPASSTPEKQDAESSTEKHQNDRISSQEPIIPLASIQRPQLLFITVISSGKDSKHSHLTNKPILINRSSLLPLTIPRRLSPHLLHIL